MLLSLELIEDLLNLDDFFLEIEYLIHITLKLFI